MEACNARTHPVVADTCAGAQLAATELAGSKIHSVGVVFPDVGHYLEIFWESHANQKTMFSPDFTRVCLVKCVQADG